MNTLNRFAPYLRDGAHMRRRFSWKTCWLPVITLAVPFLMQTSAHAFAGEDPLLGGPWHHEERTELAAVDAGFDHLPSSTKAWSEKTPDERKDKPKPDDFDAAEILGWNADYVDSYLYSPIWWVQGGFDRFKISLATAPDLERVHFDDLFDADKVRHTWRRYTMGTVAGLLWAKDQTGADGEKGDVAAAQNILGVSLHAMQDFYSHSSWINDPARREKTYFEIPPGQRPSLSIFTGAYEHDENLGVKHHGKFLYASALWNQPGVKQFMEVACGPGSPIGNEQICRDFHDSKGGIGVQPNVGGVKLPPNVLFVHPGINIDNSWSAEIGVKERGLNDLSGEQALNIGLTLARRQSAQWLKTVEAAMKKAGPDAEHFWERIKHEAPSEAERHEQFENYAKFPYQFISTGAYPPEAGTGDEYFLRLKVKTGTSGNAGTDADIRLKVEGEDGDPLLLDYSPGKNFALTHNDFEKGSEAVYSVGPFKTLPKSVTFVNDSATTGDVIKAVGKKLLDTVSAPVKTVGNILKAISGKEADWVQTNHKVWMPAELSALSTQPQNFEIDLNGDSRGKYIVSGNISKIAEGGEGASAWHRIKVHLTSIYCYGESAWDRGSNSDEPFLLGVPMGLPGESLPFKTKPYEDVDKGETNRIGVDWEFTVPKDYGMINLPLCVMEHDDESENKRQELLDTFAGKMKAEEEERGFLSTIGAAIAEDWQLGHLEVTAWTRNNGYIRVGTIHNADINKWVKGKDEYTVNFSNLAGLKPYPITVDDLMPDLSNGTQPGQPTTPTEPTTPTTPTGPTTPTDPALPSPSQLAMLDKFAGKWRTPWGVLTLVRDGFTLKGTYRRVDPMSHIEGNAETVELSAAGSGAVEGSVIFGQMVMGPLRLKLGADGDSFTGVFERGGNNDHPGQRIKDGTGAPTTPTTPTVPTIPTVPTGPTVPTVPTIPTTPTGPIPTVPTGPTTPTVPTTPGTGGNFRPLGDWAVQVESIRVARGDSIEVVVAYKNVARQRAGLGASDINMVITDADGVGTRNIGNVYRAGGDPDLEPEKMSRNPEVETAGVIKTLALFSIPQGTVPLKTLTVFGTRTKPLTFDISGVSLPDPVPAVQFPIPGAVGGSNTFSDFGEYGVRFDGIRKGLNGVLQVFISVKNMTKERPLGHPSTNLDVAIIDQDGISVRDEGNIYRASGVGLELERITHGMTIVPGGTTTICYPVPMPNGSVPKQLLVKYYNENKMLIDLPAIP